MGTQQPTKSLILVTATLLDLAARTEAGEMYIQISATPVSLFQQALDYAVLHAGRKHQGLDVVGYTLEPGKGGGDSYLLKVKVQNEC